MKSHNPRPFERNPKFQAFCSAILLVLGLAVMLLALVAVGGGR